MIDLNDFIVRPNGRRGLVRAYKLHCNYCSVDRGYKRSRYKDYPCKHCSNKQKSQATNIDFNDFILCTNSNRRKYRTTCISCGHDKGYHMLCNSNKTCKGCASLKNWESGCMDNICNSKRCFPYQRDGRIIRFKSSYELAYAKHLDSNGIKWEYEPKFKLSNGSNILPDFRLEDGTIVEIKGYFREDAKVKWDMFCREFPNIKKELLMRHELKTLGLL